ncbi:MAG: sugar phosphate isomerase/epimerase family protein [Puniceicoccaceae bacterium]
MKITSRRQFLASALGISAVGCASAVAGKKAQFKISLAQWTINKELFSGKIDNLEFAKVASEHGYSGLEYVNQFFMDKAKDRKYLSKMKKLAHDHGVESVLIMCDKEGNLGDPDKKKRIAAVDNHRKWVDAAEFLGCHSIRVNAYSEGSYDEQASLAADGLARLVEVGEKQGINVIVENHGGYSSDPEWLISVMKKVNHPMCGTLPDTGNFRIKDGVSYDSYRGVKLLMPWAKGVSIKSNVYDGHGNSSPMDFERMMRIVVDAGWTGFCGIEFGGYAGLIDSRKKLENALAAVS